MRITTTARTVVWLALVLVLVLALLTAPVAAGEPATTVRITDATDPVTASIDIAVARAQAVGPALTVLVGRDDLFPDNLAAAGLMDEAALLFVPGGPEGVIGEATIAQIRAQVGEGRACEDTRPVQVLLLGLEAAVSTGVERTLIDLGYCVDRAGGEGRVQTALAVAERVVADDPTPDQILLARADEWADAATAGAYAAAVGAPVLITPTDRLDDGVADFLRDHPAGEVVLLGGPGALSAEVEAAVAELAPTRRVAGPTRDTTAVEIIAQLWIPSVVPLPDTVTLVPGFEDVAWVFALAAASLQAPELYTQSEVLTRTAADALSDLAPGLVTVAAPPALISDAVVADAATAADPTPTDGPTGEPTPPPTTPPVITTDRLAAFTGGFPTALRVMRDDGTIEIVEEGFHFEVALSVDGTIIVVRTPVDASGRDLVLIGPDGAQQVLHDARETGLEVGSPVLSADGGLVAFVRGSLSLGVSELVIRTLATGEETVVAAPPGGDGSIGNANPQAFSPDGGTLAVRANGKLALVDTATGQLTSTGLTATDAAFDRTGQHVAFTTFVDGGVELRRLDVETRTADLLAVLDQPLAVRWDGRGTDDPADDLVVVTEDGDVIGVDASGQRTTLEDTGFGVFDTTADGRISSRFTTGFLEVRVDGEVVATADTAEQGYDLVGR